MKRLLYLVLFAGLCFGCSLGADVQTAADVVTCIDACLEQVEPTEPAALAASSVQSGILTDPPLDVIMTAYRLGQQQQKLLKPYTDCDPILRAFLQGEDQQMTLKEYLSGL